MTDRTFDPFTSVRLTASAKGIVELDLDDDQAGIHIDFGHVTFRTRLKEGEGNWSRLLDERTRTLVRAIMKVKWVTSVSISPSGGLIRHRAGHSAVAPLALKAALVNAGLVGMDDVQIDRPAVYVPADIPITVYRLPMDLSATDRAWLQYAMERLGGQLLMHENTPVGGARGRMIVFPGTHIDTCGSDPQE